MTDHAKQGKRSRRKGQAGERQFARWLREKGWFPLAFRGRQFHGRDDAPDIGGTPGVFFEVKRVERFSPYAALRQAEEDCGEGDVPVVATRKSRGEWHLFLKAADLPRLAAAIEKEDE